jgi:hypothetical protein
MAAARILIVDDNEDMTGGGVEGALSSRRDHD